MVIFSLQNLTKADSHTPKDYEDTIKELSIEGISIGDSLLNHFYSSEIENNITDVYNYKKDETFVQTTFGDWSGHSFDKYEAIQIEFKKNDLNYIVHAITGKIFYNFKDIENCYNEQDKISDELETIFISLQKYPVQVIKHVADKSGRSTVRQTAFRFINYDWIFVECYKWHKDMEYASNLKVVLSTNELNSWLAADN